MSTAKHYLMSILVVTIFWQLLVKIGNSPALVPVNTILEAFIEMLLDGTLWRNTKVSLVTIVWGLTIAAVIGFLAGSLVVEFPRVKPVVWPIVDFMRPIAALTMFPALIVLLGIGVESKIVVIFWTAWPAILLNTAQALGDADPEVLEAAQLDGANQWQLYSKMKFVLGLPLIVTGLRIGLSGGFISLVSAEMLGSSAGLGWLVLSTSQTFQFPKMYATILTIGLIGLIMNVSLYRLQEHVALNGSLPFSRFLSFGDRWLTK